MKQQSKKSVFLKSAWLAIVASLVILATGCSSKSEVVTLKLGHALDVNHPVHKGMVHMADRLAEISGGKMKIEIYPGGQLGAERELIELLQIGSLAMTKVSASPLESFAPEFSVFGIPYIFRDNDHLWNVLNGDIGKQVLASLENVKLKGLCYYDAGSRSFYTTKKAVHSPKDLEGLKIRVQKSRTSVEMIKALGGSATPIAWGELYTALQQGVVDGAENNPPSLYISKQYEPSKYYTLDEHTSVPDVLLISLKIWQGLTQEQQAWLQQAVDESVAYQRGLWQEFSDQALAEIEKSGVEIIHPDKEPFRQAVAAFHKSFEDTETGELLKQIAAVE